MLHPSKARVKHELARLARSRGDFDASRYFRGSGDLGFYNVGTAHVRALGRAIYRDNRDRWTIDDAMRLERYLRANGPRIPRTTLRYAIERFNERKRRQILAATRAVRPRAA